jgi:hypothetical protein
MWKCVSDAHIMQFVCHIHLKFDLNSYSINVRKHWKEVHCGFIRACNLKGGVEFLLQ